MAAATEGSGDTFDRKVFDEMVLRKMFVIPSFDIHGGVEGLYDLGPPVCALKMRMKDGRRSLCPIGFCTDFGFCVFFYN